MTLDRRILNKAFLVTIPFVFLFVIDPLGMRNAGEAHYEDHILRAWAPFYSDTASDDIVIILIDDTYLDQTKRWPVSYDNLSRLLKRISTFNPQMVFFDILQHHEHSNNLTRWIETLKRETETYPIYMGSDPSYDTKSRLADRNSIRHKLSKVVEFVAVGWDGHGRYYPMHVGSMNTAAYAMFKYWCFHNSGECAFQKDKNYEDAMIIQWSNKYSLQQEKFYSPIECQDLPDSNWGQLIKNVTITLTQGIYDDSERDKKLRHSCPPFLSISASSLSKYSAFDDDSLREVIQDKIVMVGYYLSGGTDLVRSPVHGSIPGVYKHAMALDNLIRLNGSHWRVPKDIGLFNLNSSDLLEIFVGYLALFGVSWFRIKMDDEKNDTKQSKAKKLIHASIPTALIVSIILGSILISHFILKVGAPSWYGLLLILLFDLPIFFIFIIRTVIPIRLIKIRLQLFLMLWLTIYYSNRL